MRRARAGALLLFAAVGLAAYFWLGPRFPKDQSVNVVLGDSAPDVTEVALSYTHDGEPLREAVLHYAPGGAPRVVHHEPRLPDGEYVIGVRVKRRDGVFAKNRHVDLRSGGSTSITLSGGA